MGRHPSCLVQDVDRERYKGQSDSEAGERATTPVSDGQNVWVVYGHGVAGTWKPGKAGRPAVFAVV